MTFDAEISRVRWLCHKLCPSLCVEGKRRGLHRELLRQRPHWSVSKREEQFRKIDSGERMPFDIALPLPAKDRGFAETAVGVELFREIFRCQRCGRCCFTPGAGLVLEEDDFQRIAEFIGSKKKLKSLCRYDPGVGAWILRQPCPFYDEPARSCKIYPVRPQTCFQYPLHPPLKEMPFNLAVDAFCPAARQLAKDTLGWWIICENNWARLLGKIQRGLR
jgi:Fe-S-cluster containining protein